MLVIGLVAAAVVLAVVVLFKLMWRVAEPNEALIITGLGAHGSGASDLGLNFKMVAGGGTFVVPLLQTVRSLNLGTRRADLQVHCVSKQGIPISVKGVAAYKIGDDDVSKANAARRFLDEKASDMQGTILELFAGHLRSIVGGTTIEDMLYNREELTNSIRTSVADDMGKLGLVVDSLQLKEIDDDSGYIDNLGKPQAADVASKARIAQANADQLATQREQEVAAFNAAARRESEVKQAGFQAEVAEAQAKAAQAGPLAEATARQAVVVQETEVAKLAALQRERQLEAEVRKPADAQAYQQVTMAKAEAEKVQVEAAAKADATRQIGQADADAQQAKGLAAAKAIEARAKALAQNPESVLNQQFIEQLPQTVAEVAKPLGDVDQMVMLNGADDLTNLVSQVLGRVFTLKDVAKSAFNGNGSNGNGEVEKKVSEHIEL